MAVSYPALHTWHTCAHGPVRMVRRGPSCICLSLTAEVDLVASCTRVTVDRSSCSKALWLPPGDCCCRPPPPCSKAPIATLHAASTTPLSATAHSTAGPRVWGAWGWIMTAGHVAGGAAVTLPSELIAAGVVAEGRPAGGAAVPGVRCGVDGTHEGPGLVLLVAADWLQGNGRRG